MLVDHLWHVRWVEQRDLIKHTVKPIITNILYLANKKAGLTLVGTHCVPYRTTHTTCADVKILLRLNFNMF